MTTVYDISFTKPTSNRSEQSWKLRDLRPPCIDMDKIASGESFIKNKDRNLGWWEPSKWH